ncbi:MAG: ATP-binding cassette domain-containing protein [bacterium]|nr:ATP-binding cassette domain-containing protein [bacterium]
MLVLKNVFYSYPGTQFAALRGVNLELPAKAIVSFQGDNGSGKTTLGLVLCGAIPLIVKGDFRGQVRWEGKALAEDLIARVCSLVFQDPYTYFSGHTVAEEAALLNDDQSRFEEIARLVIRRRDLDTPLYRLSLGQQQLLAVASALLAGRSIIVLDEPFASLDTQSSALVRELVKEARESGALVVVLQSPHRDADELDFGQCYTISRGIVQKGRVAQNHTEARPLDQKTIHTSVSLEVTGLSYAYKHTSVQVLAGVAFNIRKGESLGVFGENGVGKTTLLLLISGLLRPNGGTAVLCGERIRWRHLRKSVKCAFQNPDVQTFARSVREELSFGLKCARVEHREAERRIRAISSELPFNLDADPFALSYGQRKLLTLASTFVLGPSLVALDEPLVGLDESARSTVRKFVERFLVEGGSVLVAAHETSTLRYLCHRAVRFETGGHVREFSQ